MKKAAIFSFLIFLSLVSTIRRRRREGFKELIPEIVFAMILSSSIFMAVWTGDINSTVHH